MLQRRIMFPYSIDCNPKQSTEIYKAQQKYGDLNIKGYFPK